MTKDKAKTNEMRRFPECCDPPTLLNLSGQKGLVVGIANEHSLAWSAALHFAQARADLAITYENERTLLMLPTWWNASMPRPVLDVEQKRRGQSRNAFRCATTLRASGPSS